jgi:hypothetical protein
MLDTASAAWRAVLDAISDFQYEAAFAMVVNTPTGAEEQVLVAETWVWQHDICNPEAVVEQLRDAITAVLGANPNITSFGSVDISMWRQGAFYEQAPRIERVNRQTGTVYFEDRVPAGAQIEVCMFTGLAPRADHTGSSGDSYPARLGPRFRADRLLPAGATSWTVPTTLFQPRHGRRQFRFRYRWPAPPNTPVPAPGVRGPLSPLGICTATPGEQPYGLKIFMFASPRSPLYSERV